MLVRLTRDGPRTSARRDREQEECAGRCGTQKERRETELKASERTLDPAQEADAELADSFDVEEISRSCVSLVVNQPDVRANIELSRPGFELVGGRPGRDGNQSKVAGARRFRRSIKALWIAIRNDKSRWVWFTLLGLPGARPRRHPLL
jgi:hypothetical protein